MKIDIREYKPSDEASVIKCMEMFGDYFVDLDPMKRTRQMPGSGGWFTRKMIDDVDRNNGVIYVVESERKIVGFIAGIILKQTEEELLECTPTKAGKITELFIEEQFRGQKIGKTLMEKIEQYFKQNGCDVSRVQVFAPNIGAHDFYRKLGYQDREVEMVKIL